MPVEFDTAGMEQYDERTWFCPRTGDQVSLTYIDLVPDLPAPLDDLPQLRRRLALETADVGALIEAHVVMVDSVPTLYQLLKLPIPDQDSGQAFIAAFTMPKATCSAVLRIQCAEGGPNTGMRESAVIAELGPEAFLRPHPYAPELEGRLPWHLGDHQRYDEQFPEHPLSRARAWANKTVQTARVEPGFAQLPPFEPERSDSGGWTIPPAEPKAEPKPEPKREPKREPKAAEKRPSGAHARVEPDEADGPAGPRSRSKTPAGGAHARKARGGAHALADDEPGSGDRAAARTSGGWPKPSEVPAERPPVVPGDDETPMERTMLQAPTLGTPARGTPSVAPSSADRTRREPPSESLLESLSSKGSADSPRPEPPRRSAPAPGRRRAKKSESPAARSRSAANAERRAKSAAADASTSGPLAKPRETPPARSAGAKGSAASRSKSTPPGAQDRPGSTSQPLPRPGSTSQPLPRPGSSSQPLPRPGSTSQPLPAAGTQGRPASTSQPLPTTGAAAARAASQPLSAPAMGSPERPFTKDTKPGPLSGPASPAAGDPPRQFPASRIVTPDGITAMELTSPHSMSPLGPMRHKTDPPPMGSRTVMPPVAQPDPPAYPGGGPLGMPRPQQGGPETQIVPFDPAMLAHPANQSQRIAPVDPKALPHPANQSQRIVPVDPKALPHPANQSQRIVPVDPKALPHPANQSQRIVPVDPNAPHPANQSQRIVPVDPNASHPANLSQRIVPVDPKALPHPANQSQRIVPVAPNALAHPANQSQRMVPVDPDGLTRPVSPGAAPIDPRGFPPPGYPTDLAGQAGYPGGPADPAVPPALGPGAAGPGGFPTDLGGAPTIAGGATGQPPAGYPPNVGDAPTIGGGQLSGAYPGQPNTMGPNGYAKPDPGAYPVPGAPPANGYAAPPSPLNGYPMNPADLAGTPANYPMPPPDPMGGQQAGAPRPGDGGPPGGAMHTVLIGLPIGGFLPLWHDRSVSYWRMLDPGLVRTRLGLGVESRTEIDHKRFREAAMFSPDRNTLFLMDRYRDPAGNLGGTSTQLVPATDAEAFRAATDQALVDLYAWLGDVVVAAGERGEYVAVETGGWAVPVTPVVLIMLRTDGNEWHSVVETSPVPSGAPVWRDQQPVVGDTQLLASPATERTMRAAGLLTRFAVATWPLHPFQLGLSFGPNPTLGDFGTR